MREIRSIPEIKAYSRELARARAESGLVPTMGALHDGHLSLVERARKENDAVIVSVFVNPLQFGPEEDLASYPRDEAGDLRLLAARGVDAVFLPTVDDMYPEDSSTVVSAGPIAGILEGAHRPGHFDGVCTVVAKLFNLVAPNRAYFGQKDAQQVAVVSRMVRDLDFDIEIVVCPIVRAPGGLALSSRNAYLSAKERVAATALYRALRAGEPKARAGDFEGAEKEMMVVLETEDGVAPDYARVIDPDSFEAPSGDRVLLAVAARVGPARLIDNLRVNRNLGEG